MLSSGKEVRSSIVHMKCVLCVSYAGPILISNSDNKEFARAKEEEGRVRTIGRAKKFMRWAVRSRVNNNHKSTRPERIEVTLYENG